MSNYTVTCDCCARKDMEIQGLKNSLEIAHQGLDEFHGRIERAREALNAVPPRVRLYLKEFGLDIDRMLASLEASDATETQDSEGSA